ncbi:RNA polymerase sigma-70 factor [Pedobacter africanus]|uniref:RNA polymerase sigma-70 factor (ECF subfamily) n=1 Tax=Pedobacter africanus TaxID=151894 RepID=A0ACC6KU66_9SPHI|nr:RNA polymerase sigma-70 factor [Pedobacter africanus]MDR6782905.1 RNA polymerase sigma-70 factor (ECF subfamily) [Pedobacter africanus]
MQGYDTISDFELLDLLRSDDHAAFAELYERYKVVLYLHAKRMLADQDETKDVIQEVFTQLWIKRADIVISTSIKSYLYTSIRNKVFNLLAHRKFEMNYLNSLQQVIDLGETSVEAQLREKQLIAMIEREIEQLPSKMREVFELSRKHHLSHKEIAEKLNISDKTVKKQINNAIKILRLKINTILLVFPFL